MIANYQVNLAHLIQIVSLEIAQDLLHQNLIIRRITVLGKQKMKSAVLTLTVMLDYTVVIKSVHSLNKQPKLVSPRFKFVRIVMPTPNASIGRCAMKEYAFKSIA